MKAIILAGGVGNRMSPIEKDKCLLKFSGKELLLHQMEKMRKAGIKEFIIVCNPENETEIRKLAGKSAEYAVQKEAKGMADALLSIKELPEEALVININDIIEEKGYRDVLESKGDFVALGYEVSKYFPGGYFVIEGSSVKGIVEKPGEGKEPSNLVNVVVHLHRKLRDFAGYIRKVNTSRDDRYEVAMDSMIKAGYDFRVVRYKGFWTAIKYPWSILGAMNFFLKSSKGSVSQKAQIAKSAVIDGNITIEDGARICENAVIRGNCYIGKNAIIGNNALVRDSMIGEKSIIGFCTEVARSYIAENTMAHISYIGDSVVMDNCNFGAGTITANWRFDGKEVKVNVRGERISTGMEKFGCIMGSNSRTGINSSIMPGVKIGNNAIIGPGVLVMKDIDDNKRIFAKVEYSET